MSDISIHTPFIRLDSLLKFAGWCGTGGEAKIRIERGEILVNGDVCRQRGKKLFPGDQVEMEGQRLRVVAG